jgi:hypothetical protein
MNPKLRLLRPYFCNRYDSIICTITLQLFVGQTHAAVHLEAFGSKMFVMQTNALPCSICAAGHKSHAKRRISESSAMTIFGCRQQIYADFRQLFLAAGIFIARRKGYQRINLRHTEAIIANAGTANMKYRSASRFHRIHIG